MRNNLRKKSGILEDFTFKDLLKASSLPVSVIAAFIIGGNVISYELRLKALAQTERIDGTETAIMQAKYPIENPKYWLVLSDYGLRWASENYLNFHQQ